MDRNTHFSLTEDDMIKAMRGHVFGSIAERNTIIRLAICWVAAVALTLGLFYLLGMRDGQLQEAVLPVVILASVATLVVPIAIPLIIGPFTVRRRYRQDALVRKPLDASWDETHYMVSNDDVSNKIRWTDYLKWRDDQHQFLFFLSDYNYQILPKRVLSAEQINDLRGILSAP